MSDAGASGSAEKHVRHKAVQAPARGQLRPLWASLRHNLLWPRCVTFCTIVAYGLMYGPVFISQSVTPDDVMFLEHAQSIVPHAAEIGDTQWLATQENRLAYGALYWLVYVALLRLTDQAFWVMRALSFAAVLSIPINCYFSRPKSDPRGAYRGCWAALLWLTFPCAWWIGKVTGPEPFVVACVAMAVRCFARKNSGSPLGWLMLGLGIGIKTTAAPAAVYCGLNLLATSWRRIGRMSQAFLFGATGFVIANPFVLIRPSTFVKVSRQYSQFAWPEEPMAKALFLLSNTGWLWDSLPSCGLTQWSVTPLAAVMGVFALKACRLPKTQAVALAVTLLFVWGLLTCNAIYLGWYWFPTIALLPALYASVPWRGGLSAACALALIGTNAVGQAPFIAHNLRHNAAHGTLLARHDDIQACLQAHMPKGLGIQTVLDRSDLYTRYDFSFLQEGPRDAVRINGPRQLEERDITPDRGAYPVVGPTLLLMGDRFKAHQPFADLTHYLPRMFEHCGALHKLFRCDTIDVYVMQCRAVPPVAPFSVRSG